MLDELFRAIIWSSVALLFSSLIGVISVSFTLWLDNRSNKKALKSLFTKVRRLESELFGTVTSELDSREN